MIEAFGTAACLQRLKRSTLAVLPVALLSLGTESFAKDCNESKMPEVVHELSSRILDGNYNAFFQTLSKPTIVGGQLDYNADNISMLESAFPNGFSDCFTMLDGSRNSNHQQVLIAFFGRYVGNLGLSVVDVLCRDKAAVELIHAKVRASTHPTE